MANAFKLILLVSASILLGYLAGHLMPGKGQEWPVETKVDTMYVHDTITHTEAISVTRRVIDSIYVPVTDTLMVRDTLYMVMEKEQVVWEDSLSCIYASGIMPSVDSVRHYITDRIITIETSVPVKVKSRWGIGIQAGYGATRDGLSPYIGAGVSYNILSW